jgi:hypothetical protein
MRKRNRPGLPPTEVILGAQRSYEESRTALRAKVRFFYDLQDQRLRVQGRLVPKDPERPMVMHEIDKAILEHRFQQLEVQEKEALKDIEQHLETMPFYRDVLSDKTRFRGIGPTLAGVILAEFDIRRHDTVSKMWAYSGLRPLDARRCKRCNQVVEASSDEAVKHPKTAIPCEHSGKLVEIAETYASGKAQKRVRGEKLNYNPWLRTKLVGVMAGNLLKSGSPYRKLYDDYKHRWQSAGKGTSDGHRHNAALRYMTKMVLQDIWRLWREAEGLPIREPYAVEYLGQGRHEGQLAVPNTRTILSTPPMRDP